MLLFLCLPLMLCVGKEALPQAKSIPSVSPTDPKQITVGTNVQVSKAFSWHQHAEIHLAADPTNPMKLLGAAMMWSDERNTYLTVVYVSDDGGRSWFPTFTSTDDLLHTDPAVGLGPNGAAYLLQIVTTPVPDRDYFTYIHRSPDGGRTWKPPVIFPMLDRHYVMVDDTGGNHQGNVYVHGKQIGLPEADGFRSPGILTILHSSDGGVTFASPAQLMVSPGRRLIGGGPGVVLSDGTVVIPFAETEIDPDIEGSKFKPNGKLKVTTSIDGGETFSKAVVISNVVFGHALTSTPNHFYMAVDRSRGPFSDRIYAVWSNTYANSANIVLSYSADKGQSWSNPVVINDDEQPFDPATGQVHFRPVVAVNRHGIIGVMWYDRRIGTNRLDWSVRFTASLDGGETFLPSVVVSDSPFTHSYDKAFELDASSSGGGETRPPSNSSGGRPLRLNLAISSFYLNGGHTAGLVADANGTFHPFWVDNRIGASQIWTALVTVNGQSHRNGSLELAEFEDISQQVIISYTKPHYDYTSGTATVDAQIQNVSRETIKAPLKARVTYLGSAAGGKVSILNSDNGAAGTGAVWNFSPLLSRTDLIPGAKSSVKHLKFSITDLHPLEDAIIVRPAMLAGRIRVGEGGLQLVNLEVRILGNTRKQ